MFDAGLNAKRLSETLGHASIQITYDRHGHLMDNGEDVVRARLNDYLSDVAARLGGRTNGD
jgi:integrase